MVVKVGSNERCYMKIASWDCIYCFWSLTYMGVEKMISQPHF